MNNIRFLQKLGGFYNATGHLLEVGNLNSNNEWQNRAAGKTGSWQEMILLKVKEINKSLDLQEASS